MITTTIVRIAVARFDPTPSIPIFANIDVSAAKIAEPSANKNHIVILLQIPIYMLFNSIYSYEDKYHYLIVLNSLNQKFEIKLKVKVLEFQRFQHIIFNLVRNAILILLYDNSHEGLDISFMAETS